MGDEERRARWLHWSDGSFAEYCAWLQLLFVLPGLGLYWLVSASVLPADPLVGVLSAGLCCFGGFGLLLAPAGVVAALLRLVFLRRTGGTRDLVVRERRALAINLLALVVVAVGLLVVAVSPR